VLNGSPDLTMKMGNFGEEGRPIVKFLHSSRQTVSILYSGRPFPPKLLLLMGDLNPHLIHDSSGQCKPTV